MNTRFPRAVACSKVLATVGFRSLITSKDECLDLFKCQGLLEKINPRDSCCLFDLGIRPGVSGKEDYFAAIILALQPAIDFKSVRFAGAQVDVQDREGRLQYLRRSLLHSRHGSDADALNFRQRLAHGFDDLTEVATIVDK